MILTGSQDQTARLWDADGGRPIGPPLPHFADVYAVAFHPGGKLFATGDAAGILRVWGVPAGAKRHRLTAPGWVAGMAFHPDGRLLLAAGRPATPTKTPCRSGTWTTGGRHSRPTCSALAAGVLGGEPGRGSRRQNGLCGFAASWVGVSPEPRRRGRAGMDSHRAKRAL